MEPLRKLTSLTVVAPFFNEALGACAFYEEVVRHVDALGVPCDFVFVDDGSRDGTLAILNEIAGQDARVTVLALSRNFGHQIALTAGLDFAEGEAVVTLDADLQHPPSLIAEMVASYERGAEIVFAVRNNDEHRGVVKRLLAEGFYDAMRRAANVRILPGAVDFRLMSRTVILQLREMREMHRFLRGMVPWMGYTQAVVAYQQQPRHAGETNYSMRQLFRMARHGLFSFSTVPLDIITWLGLLMTGLAFVYLIYIIVSLVLHGREVPGWTSLAVVILIVSGVQLISVGVLAQYVGMIFEQVKQRPLYILKQKPDAQRFRNQASDDEGQLSP